MKLNALIASVLLAVFSLPASAFTKEDPAEIYMTVWRGCEEACQGFIDYLQEIELPADITIRNADRDKSTLAGFLEEAKQVQPDLVVTWGTSVSTAMIGSMDEYPQQSKLGDIPVMFMVVADPLGAGIVSSYEASGRDQVTGILNRVPEDVQIRAMQEYFDVNRLGVIYSPSELNSVLNTESLIALGEEMDFEVVTETYALNDKDQPEEGQITQLMAALKQANVDAVYVGSSSYNRSNSDEFTLAAIELGLPVVSAYDSMVTGSNGLMAVANRYYNVGRLAGSQAAKVLIDQQQSGSLPISSLSRYSIFINMDVARQLELYPPIQLLRFAELINAEVGGQ